MELTTQAPKDAPRLDAKKGITTTAISEKSHVTKRNTPMAKALNDAGCGGFFVKMTSGDSKDYSMTMQLTKAEKESFPALMFKIPSGYTESKSNLMFGNMMGAAQKQ
ncbi:MAG: DUF4412 domain-containing protein [Chitinophagaceae bacterium]